MKHVTKEPAAPVEQQPAPAMVATPLVALRHVVKKNDAPQDKDLVGVTAATDSDARASGKPRVVSSIFHKATS
jgi:hypothetical protein